MATQQIIDRRLAGKNKSIGNRERFLKRCQGQIREAVRRAVGQRGIRDLEQGQEVHIPRKDLSEPVFQHGPGGQRELVHAGNPSYVRGDRIPRPRGGGGAAGAGQASPDGESEDDFVFALSKEEFMQVFFEDLALPHLVRTQLSDTPQYRQQRAGYTSEGTPSNLHVIRSLRGAHGRRQALAGPRQRDLAQLQAQAAELERQAASDPLARSQWLALLQRMDELERRLKAIPFLDPIDLRFRHRVRVAVPSTQAVMFCLMDVSGSMDEQRKELAKRFFILLYLFLTRHYERIDLVFIRHHTQADEVSEEVFFQSRESGGTVVSSALVLMDRIIAARYDPRQWNIYGAQASDGDNWQDDSALCSRFLAERLLPRCRYYAYVQVAEPEQSLWQAYAALAGQPHFAMRKATEAAAIYPVFRELFKAQEVRP